VCETGEEPRVALPAERVEGERPFPGSVVADRGDLALRDRKLEPQRALESDDEWRGRTGGKEPLSRRRRSRRDPGGRSGSERGQEEGDDGDHADERENRDALEASGGTALTACTPKLPRFAGGRHSPHRNELLPGRQPGRRIGSL
jgi:hypothetical protein